MAKPTEKQVRDLEAAHKGQFVNLVTANRLWIGLLPKIKGKAKTDPKYLAMVSLGQKIAKLVGKWYAREIELEKAGIPKVPKELIGMFLDPVKATQLEKLALGYIKDTKLPNQVGIIPLIVWGVVALIGLFTAAYIVDETNTTAQEKAELLQETEKTLKALNITGESAKAIITETQAQASEPGGAPGIFGGGLMSKLALGLGLYFLFTQVINKPTPKTA